MVIATDVIIMWQKSYLLINTDIECILLVYACVQTLYMNIFSLCATTICLIDDVKAFHCP